MNDSSTYTPKEKYTIRYPEEKTYQHMFFPNFFMFTTDKVVKESCWLLNDVKSPELNFEFGDIP